MIDKFWRNREIKEEKVLYVVLIFYLDLVEVKGERIVFYNKDNF